MKRPIKLSENKGFVPIPEGRTIFQVVEVNYDEDFGTMDILLITENGKKQTETFYLLTKDGEVNEKATRAFSYFARVAMNDYDADEVDPDDLVGCFIECDVEHDVKPNKNDPSRTVTFLQLNNWKPANGFASVSKGKKPDLSKLL